jgi:tetratricopeptide (TPR) repeat protein
LSRWCSWAATWQALRATRAEHGALLAAAAEKAAKDEALAREAETKAVLEFVVKRVFSAARPDRESEGLGRKVTLLKAIESALQYVDKGFSGKPLIEARLRASFGTSFAALGDLEKAAQQDEAARALYARYRGADHPDTLAAVNALANDYEDMGRFQESARLHEENLAMLKATRGPDHFDTIKSMNNLAIVYSEMARHDEALKLREETLALSKRTLGPENPETLAHMQNLAQSYYAFARYAEGVALYEETLAIQKRTLGAKHPDTLISMHNLAAGYAALERYTDALKLQEETLALRQAVLGPDHPFTLTTMGNLARTYDYLGRHAEAAKLNEQTLALRKAKLGPNHPYTLSSMYQLGISDAALGRHADALKLFEETLVLRKSKLGPSHPKTVETKRNVAEELFALNRDAEVLPIIDECAQQATGLHMDPPFLPGLIHLRGQYFQKVKDPAGCRQTAVMWEKINRTDAAGLACAASLRAVAAAAFRANDKSPSGTHEADLEADRAMGWLKQAVAAGYKNTAALKQDKDFDALRGRDDFKKLTADLEQESARAERDGGSLRRSSAKRQAPRLTDGLACHRPNGEPFG